MAGVPSSLIRRSLPPYRTTTLASLSVSLHRHLPRPLPAVAHSAAFPTDRSSGMAEESPLTCPYCGEQFTLINHYWKHVQSANCSGGDCPESENVLPSSQRPKPVNAAFFSQPLAPSAFRSPDTSTGSASIPSANNEKVGACKRQFSRFFMSSPRFDLKRSVEAHGGTLSISRIPVVWSYLPCPLLG
nr:unnamed protein product [Spirometra erinaceieuropaei]